jgi:hypothetical protein
MANVTVKKNDGTTDITYDALSGSGGDSMPAMWRQDTGNTAGLPVGLRANAQLNGAWNGPKTARRLSLTLKQPYAVQDSTTTLYSAKDQVIVEISAVIPQGIPSTWINEAVSQSLNFAAATLTKDSFKAGYPPV